MARQNAASAQSAPMHGLNVDGYQLKHIKWSENSKYCRFTLELPFGVSLYGCKLIYDKGGMGYIVPASDKGKDGKYYPRYFLRMAPEMEQKIIVELEEQ